jgi:hypothetical protein
MLGCPEIYRCGLLCGLLKRCAARVMFAHLRLGTPMLH